LRLQSPAVFANTGDDNDTVLTFEGVGKSFTQNPFLLTMEAAKENLHGWTGKN